MRKLFSTRALAVALFACGLFCDALHCQTTNAPQQRLPRERPKAGSIVGVVRSAEGAPLGGAKVSLESHGNSQPRHETSSRANGWFAFRDIPAGSYTIRITLAGYEPMAKENTVLKPGDSLPLALNLRSLATLARVSSIPHPGIEVAPAPPPVEPSPHRELVRPERQEPVVARAWEPLAEDDQVFIPVSDRWKYQFPEFRRYSGPGDFQYIRGRWYDPYNANRLKGDLPVIGNRVFVNLSLASETYGEGRLLPLPPIPSRAPATLGSGQTAAIENLSLSAEIFGGDAAFRPADWRLRVTPVGNVNFAAVQAPGLLNFTKPETSRLATRFGLQEAFGEVKLHDLSNEYDFVSLRAGIQNFNSDFRGFLFSSSEPGLRLFGSLASNKYQYNLAGFIGLVKDANSGLNILKYRNQQVYIANLYRQDFLRKGYTIEFSFHYDKEDPSSGVNANNFQVRPVPIGPSVLHSVRAYYYGVAGDGHLGRLNVSHQFYQALGNDSYNALAGRPVKINAQMGALELSVDRDWIRYRTSVFYASGARDPRSGVARGFDTILDNPSFAGGVFSFWNRENIDISGRGVSLVNAGSLVPDIRSGKASGQASFVNPGLYLYNAGADIDFTPKLRAFLNVNLIRFANTQPLEVLLNMQNIRAGVGIDSGVGLRYRPALSDNIIVTMGVSNLVPFEGFRQIYTGRFLFASFVSILFRY